MWPTLSRLVAPLLVLLVLVPASAEQLAVLDKSRPEEAGLSLAMLGSVAQAVRGEARRQLPSQVGILSDENTMTILQDMGVNPAECTGECEVAIARKLKADWLLSIQVLKVSDSWNLQVNLFRTMDGSLQSSERQSTASQEALAGLLEQMTGRVLLPLRGALAPAPVAATGLVRVPVVTRPAGATLTVDGAWVGETPITAELTAGPHSLRLSMPRHEERELRLTVAPGLKVDEALVPLFGHISVHSKPAGHPVWLDGRRLERPTPVDSLLVGHGPHEVMVGDSQLVWTLGERIILEKGARQTLLFELPPRTGGLELRVQNLAGHDLERPLLVDGKKVGTSPLQLRLPCGEHQVAVEGAPNYAAKRLTVRDRQVQQVVIELP